MTRLPENSIAGEFLVPMPPAEGNIFLVAADVDLRTLADKISRAIEPGDHRRLPAAMTDSADLPQLVGNREERHRARKKLTLKVGAQTISHDWNGKPVRDTGQLPDMAFGQELRLIDKDTSDRALGGKLFHLAEQIAFRLECPRVRRKPDARSNMP